MAWCPFAVHKPIAKKRSVITPRAIIAHTAVSDSPSLFAYFSGVGDDSHFYVDKTGRIEQYVDTELSAYANRDANLFAVSFETWDGRTPERTPWTPPQVVAIIRLCDWLATTHRTIRRQQINSVTGTGLGWHVMFGAPSAWTGVVKTCPAGPRIAQMKSTIIPAFVSGTTPPPPSQEEPDMQLTDKMPLFDGTTVEVQQAIAGILARVVDLLGSNTKLAAMIIAADANDVTAAAVASALRGNLVSDLIPIVRQALTDGLGEGNAAQAEEIATEVLNQMSAKLASNGVN